MAPAASYWVPAAHLAGTKFPAHGQCGVWEKMAALCLSHKEECSKVCFKKLIREAAIGNRDSELRRVEQTFSHYEILLGLGASIVV